MLLDALGLVLLALFVLLGARRGALSAVLSLAGLLVGYGAAFLLAPAVGPPEDPELHRRAADPEVLQLLDQGQVLGLLTHPGIQRLVARALSDQATL